MGAGQSAEQSDQLPTRALHVLRVTPSSPASQTTIEPFFDFVVGYEGDSSSQSHSSSIDATELEKIVERHEGRTLNLLIWNSKNRNTRVVPIIPSRAWSQSPQSTPSTLQPSLLGLSMRMCQPELALDNVWHVLDVLEGSPAESAGLVPYGDYITGWSGGVLSAENDFYDLVEAHVDKPLRVYVYSHDFDALREVVLVPNRHWGGEGLLGCVFGFGLLHRIPPTSTEATAYAEPPEYPEHVDDYEEQNLFVPADTEVQEIHYDPDELAQWRQQEQNDWHRETVETQSIFGQHPSTTAVSPIPEEGSPERDDHPHHHHNHHHHDGPPASTPEVLHRNPSILANARQSPLTNGSRSFSPRNEATAFHLRSMVSTPKPSIQITPSEDDDSHEERSVTETDSGSLTSVD